MAARPASPALLEQTLTLPPEAKSAGCMASDTISSCHNASKVSSPSLIHLKEKEERERERERDGTYKKTYAVYLLRSAQLRLLPNFTTPTDTCRSPVGRSVGPLADRPSRSLVRLT